MRWLALALWLALSGCASVNRDIEGDDDHVFMPSLLVSLGGPIGAFGDSAFLVEWYGGAQLEITGGSGDFNQTLATGDRVGLGSLIVQGPGTFEVDYDLLVATASGVGGVRVHGLVDLQMITGLGIQELGIRLTQGGSRDRDTVTTVGVNFGFRAAVVPTEWLEFYGRWMAHSGIASDVIVDVQSFEVGVLIRPARHLGLALGWRSWSYEAEFDEFVVGGVPIFVPSFDRSEIDVEMSGPMVQLVLEF